MAKTVAVLAAVVMPLCTFAKTNLAWCACVMVDPAQVLVSVTVKKKEEKEKKKKATEFFFFNFQTLGN